MSGALSLSLNEQRIWWWRIPISSLCTSKRHLNLTASNDSKKQYNSHPNNRIPIVVILTPSLNGPRSLIYGCPEVCPRTVDVRPSLFGIIDLFSCTISVCARVVSPSLSRLPFPSPLWEPLLYSLKSSDTIAVPLLHTVNFPLALMCTLHSKINM